MLKKLTFLAIKITIPFMKILKFIKSIFGKDYVLNHYEQFIIDSLLDKFYDDDKEILLNQLQRINLKISIYDYDRNVRQGFSKFYFKKDLSTVLTFDTLRKTNTIAELVILDKDNYEYQVSVNIDNDGLLEEFHYLSNKNIGKKNKYLPKKPYLLKSIVIYEY